MMEKMPTTENQEIIPTPEEIESVFHELIGGEKAWSETKRLEDDKGLYCLEVEIQGEDGTVTEYGYMRKGCFGRNQSSATEITATYYQDGMPISGTTVATLIDGKWEII
jgi:hypothetical protein